SLLFRQKAIAKILGTMIKSCTNSATKLRGFFAVSSDFVAFLPAMTNWILSFWLLSFLLSLSMCLCEHYLKTTEGNVVHYGFIEAFIEELGMKYNIREIAFDRWGATQMVQNLEGLGFTVVPFGQGFKDMSPPTKELMRLTLDEKIAHGGHPVLRWMMDNIHVRTDPAGNVKPDKEKSTEKIDGAVAAIMALDRAIRGGGDTGASIYDGRGLLIL
ncbi:hypothetical protein C814_01273, partial [Anaerotruncus sp. G3(2012)]